MSIKFRFHLLINMMTPKQIRRAIRRPFETGGFKLLQLLIPLLPRGTVLAFARFAGHIMWILPTREKRYGLINLDAVFGETKTPAEKRAILRSSFSTFSLTMLDLFWFAKDPEKRIGQYVSFEEDTSIFLGKKPIVCITAHIGNWEIMGQAGALMGADLASIAATIKNEGVNKILIEQRQRTGQIIIPQKGALRTLIARLRNGGIVGFVLDQNTDPKNGGIPVEFLGLPMSVSSAPAALAYRTGTPIMLNFCLPDKKGYYVVRDFRLITPPPFDKQADTDAIVHDLTQQIEDGVSDEIRKHPAYWLWSYKHWRRLPGEEYPAHYPRY